MVWRVGNHYPFHVYDEDEPVATFFKAQDARRAVSAVNKEVAVAEYASRGAFTPRGSAVPHTIESVREELVKAQLQIERLETDLNQLQYVVNTHHKAIQLFKPSS